jgi:hypothetical protein
MPARAHVVVPAVAIAVVSLPAVAGDRLIATIDIADLNVVGNGAVDVPVTFPGVDPSDTVSAIGLTAGFTLVQGDTGGGTGPWALDVRLTATAPTGPSFAWNPIGGEFTIANYPLQDASNNGFNDVPAQGEWTFRFDSTESVSNWIYGLRDVRVHLLTDAPDVVTQYTAEPDPANQWDRPFFIAGVSGLGPVAYDAFTFTVTESGRYTLESVLPTTADHYTCFYRGDFDPELPLTNLLENGLGNGFSPFEEPRGTSRIRALLIEGETYTWVTSQWARTSAIQAANNTITGPGNAVEVTACVADFNGDGTVSILDVVAYVTVWNTGVIEADFNNDGTISIFDVVAFITEWNAGCP